MTLRYPSIFSEFFYVVHAVITISNAWCSSADGRRLFREALIEGNMESYFRLAEQFRTQDDLAFCGLSTLTMVLNALAVDPGRVWKGE